MNLFMTESTLDKEEPWDVLKFFGSPDSAEEVKSMQIVDRYTYQETISYSKPISERIFLDFYLRTSSFKRTYISEPYNVLDYLGDIGGVMDITFFTVGILISGYVGISFQLQLIGESYQVDRASSG